MKKQNLFLLLVLFLSFLVKANTDCGSLTIDASVLASLKINLQKIQLKKKESLQIKTFLESFESRDVDYTKKDERVAYEEYLKNLVFLMKNGRIGDLIYLRNMVKTNGYHAERDKEITAAIIAVMVRIIQDKEKFLTNLKLFLKDEKDDRKKELIEAAKELLLAFKKLNKKSSLNIQSMEDL